MHVADNLTTICELVTGTALPFFNLNIFSRFFEDIFIGWYGNVKQVILSWSVIGLLCGIVLQFVGSIA
jgi:hypothetical protein